MERLQRIVWGHGDLDVVPDHLLITMQKNGGQVLAAFETLPGQGEPGQKEECAIGLAFGFVGLSPAGKIKHCSHMVGVDPAYQDRNVGYRLKLAQREHGTTPTYQLLDEKGPDHSKCFEVSVSISGKHYPSAWGMTKKQAEQTAARHALIEMGVIEDDEGEDS